MVRLAIIWRSPPSGFPYKQPLFYCIFSSSCGVLEVWIFPPVLAAPLSFFPLVLLNRSKFVSFLVYCCFFWLSLTFSNAIGPFLTLLGPRNLPAYPTRCTIGYLTCGRRLFGAKTSKYDLFMSNPNICFCAGSNHYFCRHVSLLISDIFSAEAFFPTVALLLIFSWIFR